MWIMTSYGIIMPAVISEKIKLERGLEKYDLQVRARDRAALQHVRSAIIQTYGLRNASVELVSRIDATPTLDYEYRVYVDADAFATVMYNEILAIDYEKFKPTTERSGGGGEALHNLYNSIWAVVARFYGSAALRPAPRINTRRVKV